MKKSIHMLQLLAIALATAITSAAMAANAKSNPDFSGVWLVSSTIQQLKTVDGRDPPLTSAASQAYAAHVAQWRAGDQSFDPVSKCVSPGMPRMLYLPYPFQIIQRPKRITYLFEWNYWNRHVAMSSHVEAPYPLAMGESHGYFQHGDLVIESDGFRADNTFLDSVGLPHSDRLHLTERMRLTKGGSMLVDRIRIDDSVTFTHPWETVIEFKRLPENYEMPMDICLDRTDSGQPAVDWSRKLLP
jgi:hypothetical protein